MKSSIKRLSDIAASMLSWREAPRGVTSTLLAPFYHVVSDEPVPHIGRFYRVKNVREFEADIEYLLANFKPIDLQSLLASLADGSPLPERSFFLSFDDGMRETYEVIAPVLQRLGVPATFFLTTEFLDNEHLFWRSKACLLATAFAGIDEPRVLREAADRLDEGGIRGRTAEERIVNVTYEQREVLEGLAALAGLDFAAFLAEHRPYLTWDQARELTEMGFTVGAHSIDHPRYGTLPLSEQLRQTRESTDLICKRLGLDYKAFAFPFDEKGVTESFYEEIFADDSVDVTFGVSAFRCPHKPRRIQRLWMEDRAKNARQRILGEHLRCRLRRALPL